MVKKQSSDNDMKSIAQYLKNLLAIELWRSGLSQAEIGKRLGIATGSVNKMLKGISKEVQITVQDKG